MSLIQYKVFTYVLDIHIHNASNAANMASLVYTYQRDVAMIIDKYNRKEQTPELYARYKKLIQSLSYGLEDAGLTLNYKVVFHKPSNTFKYKSREPLP